MNAITSVFSAALLYWYNIAFLHYTSFLIDNSFKGKTIPTVRLHLFPFVMSFLGLYFMWDKLGLSPAGTCSTDSKAIYAALSLPLLYVIYGMYTLRRISNGIPKMTKDKKFIMKSLTTSYYRYIVTFSILWISIGVVLILGKYFV